ncbi:hypothetical protein ATE49_15315 [Elizabethkingia miricola]|uniref:Holin n=1 Tax=Elizabethkingia miricola TaxID=172045 RepID=A0ABY3NFH6_ELIMR|nr:hypothetical protein [Elizabethkingia miricola]OBS12823.1 hypothetical protein ATE49_15315 [Elizabethkingia miricola]TYO84791.1 hypothetical protein LX74_03851 [Elizabethkingia miricola]TYO91697.1 hypothetical protein LX74_01941 [Elizabethkingia miricola]
MTQNELLYDASRITAILLTIIVGVLGRIGYLVSQEKKIKLGMVLSALAMAVFAVFVGEALLLNSGYKDYRLPALTLISFFSHDLIVYLDKNKKKYLDRFFNNKNNNNENNTQ